jgi:hypothetical protein
MAAPNIVNVTTITGKTSVLVVTDTAQDIVTNSAGSGKVIKINGLSVANVNGVLNGNVTVDLYRATVAYHIAYLIAVPPKSTLIVIGKDVPIYLEEGDSLRVTADLNSYLEAVASYEEIS